MVNPSIGGGGSTLKKKNKKTKQGRVALAGSGRYVVCVRWRSMWCFQKPPTPPIDEEAIFTFTPQWLCDCKSVKQTQGKEGEPRDDRGDSGRGKERKGGERRGDKRRGEIERGRR